MDVDRSYGPTRSILVSSYKYAATIRQRIHKDNIFIFHCSCGIAIHPIGSFLRFTISQLINSLLYYVSYSIFKVSDVMREIQSRE